MYISYFPLTIKLTSNTVSNTLKILKLNGVTSMILSTDKSTTTDLALVVTDSQL